MGEDGCALLDSLDWAVAVSTTHDTVVYPWVPPRDDLLQEVINNLTFHKVSMS